MKLDPGEAERKFWVLSKAIPSVVKEHPSRREVGPFCTLSWHGLFLEKSSAVDSAARTIGDRWDGCPGVERYLGLESHHGSECGRLSCLPGGGEPILYEHD